MRMSSTKRYNSWMTISFKNLCIGTIYILCMYLGMYKDILLKLEKKLQYYDQFKIAASHSNYINKKIYL